MIQDKLGCRLVDEKGETVKVFSGRVEMKKQSLIFAAENSAELFNQKKGGQIIRVN